MRYLLGLLWILCCQANAEIRVKDDLDNHVVLEQPATRIVSLAPHLTEILFSLGVGDKIVGTVRYSDFPPQAKQIPHLGDAFSLNLESVLAMRPDIIFAWHTGGVNRPIQRLKDLGIAVYVNEARTLGSIAAGLNRISKLVGASEQGSKLEEAFLQTLDELAVTYTVRPVVFFQISDQDLYTVNDKHLIGQAINHCGALNLFADIEPSVTLVSKEAILAGDPDLLILTQQPGGIRSPWLARWRDYEDLKGRLRTIDPSLISRPSFRMLDGVKELCRLISESNK